MAYRYQNGDPVEPTHPFLRMEAEAGRLYLDSLGGKWLAGPIVCRVCGHKATSVRPVEADQDSLECGNCGAMTCEPDASS